MKIELTVFNSFDSEDSSETIGKILEKLIYPHHAKSHIYDYMPHYLLLDCGPLAGCYHFVFNENDTLQTIKLHIMDIKKYKLHRLTLWKRHWWT